MFYWRFAASAARELLRTGKCGFPAENTVFSGSEALKGAKETVTME